MDFFFCFKMHDFFLYFILFVETITVIRGDNGSEGEIGSYPAPMLLLMTVRKIKFPEIEDFATLKKLTIENIYIITVCC